MNTKQKIGRACMIVGILLILGALALLGYNQWDANRADKASQDALGKLEETLTETMALDSEISENLSFSTISEQSASIPLSAYFSSSTRAWECPNRLLACVPRW